jgi:hypothetical protein
LQRVSPREHIRAQPELAPAAAEVDDGTRHVDVTVLVDADVVRMRQTENLGDASCVYQVFG